MKHIAFSVEFNYQSLTLGWLLCWDLWDKQRNMILNVLLVQTYFLDYSGRLRNIKDLHDGTEQSSSIPCPGCKIRGLSLSVALLEQQELLLNRETHPYQLTQLIQTTLQILPSRFWVLLIFKVTSRKKTLKWNNLDWSHGVKNNYIYDGTHECKF